MLYEQEVSPPGGIIPRLTPLSDDERQFRINCIFNDVVKLE